MISTDRVYVADAGNAFDRALAAGARVVTQPTTLAVGERVARVRDPKGHLWWIHQRIENVPAEDLASRFAGPAARKAMAYVQQTLTRELSRSRVEP